MRRTFQWTLFAAFFVALPLPYYAFVVAGLMPLSAALLGLLATGSSLDLVHLIVLTPLVYLLATWVVAWSWKLSPPLRVVPVLAAFGLAAAFALAPSYGLSHGSTGRSASLVELFGQAPHVRQYRQVGARIGVMPAQTTAIEQRAELEWQSPSRVKAGQEFPLELMVSANVPVGLVSTIVTFDAQALECVSVSEGRLLSGAGAKTQNTPSSKQADQCGMSVHVLEGTGGRGPDAAVRFVFKAIGSRGLPTTVQTAILQVGTTPHQPFFVSLPASPTIVVEP